MHLTLKYTFNLKILLIKLLKNKLKKLLGSYPTYKGYNPFFLNFKKFLQNIIYNNFIYRHFY